LFFNRLNDWYDEPNVVVEPIPEKRVFPENLSGETLRRTYTFYKPVTP
jgi:hypothetical protein